MSEMREAGRRERRLSTNRLCPGPRGQTCVPPRPPPAGGGVHRALQPLCFYEPLLRHLRTLSSEARPDAVESLFLERERREHLE